MVSAAGFEPATYSLEGCCSIQLSYADNNKVGASILKNIEKIKVYD